MLANFGIRQIRRILNCDPQPTPAEALAWMLFTHLPSQSEIEDRAAVAASRLLNPPPAVERSTEWHACHRLAQQPIEVWIDLWAAQQWNAELGATGRSLLPIWRAVASHLPVSDEFCTLAERLYADEEPLGENIVFSSEQDGLPGPAIVSAAIDPQRVFAHFAHRQGQSSYRPTPRDRTLLDELLADGFTFDQVLAGIDRAFDRRPPDHSPIKRFAFCVPEIRTTPAGSTVSPELVNGQAQAMWQSAMAELELQMTRMMFNTWIRPTTLLSWDDEQVVIGVPNRYVKDWLENRLIVPIQRTLTGTAGCEVEVQFVILEEARG